MGSCRPCPTGTVEGRGKRAALALGFFSFQIHPFLFLRQCQAAQARAIGAGGGGHFYTRRATLFTQKEQARVPMTSLLILSNTLLHHPGAKMPLLVFFGGVGRKHKG